MEAAPGTVALAGRASMGDSAALDELLAELRPLTVQTARLVVGSGSWAAEDAAQEALKVARRERLLRVRSAPVVEGLVAPAPAEEREAALKQAFDRLSPRLRATAVLRLYAGLSEEEAADVLGCSVGTVKSNLHDARGRLTRALSEAGYAPTVEQRKGELR